MKGINMMGGLFALLMAGIIAGVAFPVILPGQATKITPLVEEKEFENKALLLANSLMNDENIAYNDGQFLNRGVLDANKLDLTKSGDISLEESYPDTTANIIIEDIDDYKIWTLTIRNQDAIKPTRSTTILNEGLPVTIRYSDTKIHLGTMKVVVIE